MLDVLTTVKKQSQVCPAQSLRRESPFMRDRSVLYLLSTATVHVNQIDCAWMKIALQQKWSRPSRPSRQTAEFSVIFSSGIRCRTLLGHSAAQVWEESTVNGLYRPLWFFKNSAAHHWALQSDLHSRAPHQSCISISPRNQRVNFQSVAIKTIVKSITHKFLPYQAINRSLIHGQLAPVWVLPQSNWRISIHAQCWKNLRSSNLHGSKTSIAFLNLKALLWWKWLSQVEQNRESTFLASLIDRVWFCGSSRNKRESGIKTRRHLLPGIVIKMCIGKFTFSRLHSFWCSLVSDISAAQSAVWAAIHNRPLVPGTQGYTCTAQCKDICLMGRVLLNLLSFTLVTGPRKDRAKSLLSEQVSKNPNCSSWFACPCAKGTKLTFHVFQPFGRLLFLTNIKMSWTRLVSCFVSHVLAKFCQLPAPFCKNTILCCSTVWSVGFVIFRAPSSCALFLQSSAWSTEE